MQVAFFVLRSPSKGIPTQRGKLAIRDAIGSLMSCEPIVRKEWDVIAERMLLIEHGPVLAKEHHRDPS